MTHDFLCLMRGIALVAQKLALDLIWPCVTLGASLKTDLSIFGASEITPPFTTAVKP